MTVHTLHSCGGEVTIQTNRFVDRLTYNATCDKCGRIYSDTVRCKWRETSTPAQKKDGQTA
jgi:hypothetical protein